MNFASHTHGQSLLLCEYGCGNPAKFKMKSGSLACSPNLQNCDGCRTNRGFPVRNSQTPGTMGSSYGIHRQPSSASTNKALSPDVKTFSPLPREPFKYLESLNNNSPLAANLSPRHCGVATPRGADRSLYATNPNVCHTFYPVNKEDVYYPTKYMDLKREIPSLESPGGFPEGMRVFLYMKIIDLNESGTAGQPMDGGDRLLCLGDLSLTTEEMPLYLGRYSGDNFFAKVCKNAHKRSCISRKHLSFSGRYVDGEVELSVTNLSANPVSLEDNLINRGEREIARHNSSCDAKVLNFWASDSRASSYSSHHISFLKAHLFWTVECDDITHKSLNIDLHSEIFVCLRCIYINLGTQDTNLVSNFDPRDIRIHIPLLEEPTPVGRSNYSTFFDDLLHGSELYLGTISRQHFLIYKRNEISYLKVISRNPIWIGNPHDNDDQGLCVIPYGQDKEVEICDGTIIAFARIQASNKWHMFLQFQISILPVGCSADMPELSADVPYRGKFTDKQQNLNYRSDSDEMGVMPSNRSMDDSAFAKSLM